jgi:hypothetical protein
MIFIETSIFTKWLPTYLSDDEYWNLQNFLMEKPEAGDIIQGAGGLRKLRWSLNNKGKRGGIRIIYYRQIADDHIYMMTLYTKSEMTDLSTKDKKALKQMIERW